MNRNLVNVLLFCMAPFFCRAQTPDRSKDPVVITGSDLPCLVNQTNLLPDDIVGFRVENGTWVQIPVQADEILVDSIAKPWGPEPAAYDCRLSKRNTPWFVSFYADPNTYTGADPDASFDANDELAFMARDAGVKLGTCLSQPAGTTGDPCEVTLTDPIDNSIAGYVYLFKRTGNLDPGAGANLVSYNFTYANGYKGNAYDECEGANNPENSTISTNNYFCLLYTSPSPRDS